MGTRATVIRFPTERITRPASGGWSWVYVLRSRARRALGAVLNRVGTPGAIQNTSVHDEVTGQQLSVAVSNLYVRVSVDGRDYYFDRITGRFDGTGSSPSRLCDSRQDPAQG